jgi:hypothetical protein
MITLIVTPEGYQVEDDQSGFRETLEDLIDAATTAKDEAKSSGCSIRIVPGCEGVNRLGTPEGIPMEVQHWQIQIVNGEVHVKY